MKYTASPSTPAEMRNAINACPTSLGGTGVLGGLFRPCANQRGIAPPIRIDMASLPASRVGTAPEKSKLKQVGVRLPHRHGGFLSGLCPARRSYG